MTRSRSPKQRRKGGASWAIERVDGSKNFDDMTDRSMVLDSSGIGGPLGEEFGWRGFALPNLQRKWGPIAASIVIGIVWALWHLPLFFQPDTIHSQIGLALLPVYVIGEIVLAIIITWVYNKMGSSLLVGGIILHNADNFWASTLLINETMTTAFQGGA